MNRSNQKGPQDQTNTAKIKGEWTDHNDDLQRNQPV